MRLLVMFDLPVTEPDDRKAASRFRQFLLHDGYCMIQFSVYVRICNGLEAVEKHKLRLQQHLPHSGSVRMFVITERQFEAMQILCGQKIPDVDENKKENTVIVL